MGEEIRRKSKKLCFEAFDDVFALFFNESQLVLKRKSPGLLKLV